jgi:hypothetical protein
LASFTWSSTRHWLRRWIEIVGALLFSKIAMAVVFVLGLSATGATSQGNNPADLSTFLAGVLLLAMAAFAPAATFSFIHWAGDQGHSAARAIQQGSVGAAAAREGVEKAQHWGAEHFGTSLDKTESPVVGDDTDRIDDEAIIDRAEADASSPGDTSSPMTGGSDASNPASAPADGQPEVSTAPPPSSGGEGATAVAVATSEASVDGPPVGDATPGVPDTNSTTDTGEDRG